MQHHQSIEEITRFRDWAATQDGDYNYESKTTCAFAQFLRFENPDPLGISVFPDHFYMTGMEPVNLDPEIDTACEGDPLLVRQSYEGLVKRLDVLIATRKAEKETVDV